MLYILLAEQICYIWRRISADLKLNYIPALSTISEQFLINLRAWPSRFIYGIIVDIQNTSIT